MARQYRKVRRYGILYEKAFFVSLAKNPNVTEACEASGMPAAYVYRQKMQNPAFKEKYDEAIALGLQACEDRAQELAFKGVRTDVYYQGKVVGEQYEPSERLVEFWLKANKPEKYRESSMTFNMGANSLVQVLSAMPRSDAVEEKPLEAIEVKEDGEAETRPPGPD